MDWVFGTGGTEEVDRARSSVVDHLRRHASDSTAVDACADILRTRLAVAARRADGRPLHVALAWSSAEVHFDFAAMSVPEEVASLDVRSDGSVPVHHRRSLRSMPKDGMDDLALPIVPARLRLFEAGPPPAPPPANGDLPGTAAAAVLALAAATETYPSAGAAESALIAGAAIAESTSHPANAAEAAATFTSVHASFGGEAEVVGADDGRLEIAISACPFRGDKAGVGSFSLCHLTLGLAGQLAARVGGSARGLLDEHIARGDQECRLEVLLGDAEDDRAQLFYSPQRATAPKSSVPHLELTVALPREGVSVPVVRRLAAQALRAFGVHPDDVDDVQVAISEACGNVIDHAEVADTYDVHVDLAADRCTITVIDQGGGFDASAVPAEAERAAESGRGLQLMRALVDNVAFRNEPQAGAVVHMVKALRYDYEHPLQRIRP